jgi:hypothetical protein
MQSFRRQRFGTCKYTPSHSNNEWKGIGIFSLQLCVFARARTRKKGIEYVNAFSKKATLSCLLGDLMLEIDESCKIGYYNLTQDIRKLYKDSV